MTDNLKEREAFESALSKNSDVRFWNTTDAMFWAWSAALAQAQSCVPAEPPFGSKRNAALALYRPPFKFLHGYIYDADGKMCADEGAMPEHVAARVRGWGRIGYMPDAEALQDEVGQVIAEALTSFWLAASTQPQPVQPSEPVFWALPERDGEYNAFDAATVYRTPKAGWSPLYRAPSAQAKSEQAAQPLTDEEIADIWDNTLFHVTDISTATDFVRDVEDAHGIAAPQPKD